MRINNINIPVQVSPGTCTQPLGRPLITAHHKTQARYGAHYCERRDTSVARGGSARNGPSRTICGHYAAHAHDADATLF